MFDFLAGAVEAVDGCLVVPSDVPLIVRPELELGDFGILFDGYGLAKFCEVDPSRIVSFGAQWYSL